MLKVDESLAVLDLDDLSTQSKRRFTIMAKRKKKKVTRKKKTTKRNKKVTRKKKTTKRNKKVTRKKKTTKRNKKVTRKKKTTKKKSGKKRKPNPAFMKEHKVTDQLKAVIGKSKISRPQATKLVWAYIKKSKLQDKKNGRLINIGNSKLKGLFSKSQISMFDIPKGINKHLK